MIAIENVNNFVTGVYPDANADNSTGAATQDGFEFIAEMIDNSIIGPQQAIMDYAGLTPDGVTEAAGASQMIDAILKMSGTGPGKGVLWFNNDLPGVTGDRVLLLEGQRILISVYDLLDAALYVGDANNAAVFAGGGAFYRSSDAAGLVPDIAGPYLKLPDARGQGMRVLDPSGVIDPDGASRFLGDLQGFATQLVTGKFNVRKRDDGTTLIDNTTTGPFTEAIGGASLQTVTQNATSLQQQELTFDNSLVAQTATEERMKNMSIKLGVTY